MKMRVAIAGAGAAGAICGRMLRDSGIEVTLFEKSRGPGGRAARRREEPWHFDHGAQYLTVRTSEVKRALDDLILAGAAAVWRPRLATWRNGAFESRSASKHPRYVGTPGMSAICRSLVDGLDVRYGAKVEAVEHDAHGWTIRLESGESAQGFTHFVSTLPPPQAGAICALPQALRMRLEGTTLAPCWALMVGLGDGAVTSVPYDGLFVSGEATDGPHMALSWIVRNSSKPGRPEAEAWVAHATPEWSKKNLELDHREVEKQLLERFLEITGIDRSAVAHTRTHRWRYARASVTDPPERRCYTDPERRLFLGGDWCVDGRVEGALLSGIAIASDIMERKTHPPQQEQSGCQA